MFLLSSLRFTDIPNTSVDCTSDWFLSAGFNFLIGKMSTEFRNEQAE